GIRWGTRSAFRRHPGSCDKRNRVACRQIRCASMSSPFPAALIITWPLPVSKPSFLLGKIRVTSQGFPLFLFIPADRANQIGFLFRLIGASHGFQKRRMRFERLREFRARDAERQFPDLCRQLEVWLGELPFALMLI